MRHQASASLVKIRLVEVSIPIFSRDLVVSSVAIVSYIPSHYIDMTTEEKHEAIRLTLPILHILSLLLNIDLSLVVVDEKEFYASCRHLEVVLLDEATLCSKKEDYK
jgi:hypothetical protein